MHKEENQLAGSLMSEHQLIEQNPPASAWLFVRVIDNFGDAGVAWRLAQGLVQELNLTVQLWIDEPAVLTQLVPATSAASWSDRIQLHHWQQSATMIPILAQLPDPEWVIEMFGCDLPEPVLQRMTHCRPLWLNWEYLSFEDWAVDLHAMPSLQTNAVAKYFWFMGTDDHSGGLLREPDYAIRQQTFKADAQQQQAFCQHYGLPLTHQGQLWLIFAYHAPIWVAWLHMWQASQTPITLWLAGAQVIEALRTAGIVPATALAHDGDQYQYGHVTLVRIAFVPQAVFDQLLWLADGAIVRGEDSLTRALWAGIPFFWHIYPQADHAHWQKLHALWQPLTQTWSAAWQHDFTSLSDDLNGVIHLPPADRLWHWQQLMQHWSSWQQAVQQASMTLQAKSTAMEKLARFRSHQLK